MARQKEFDPEVALDDAMRAFWAGGFDGTSTQALMARMGIGKRSMYDTYGDKRDLYLSALRRYVELCDQSSELIVGDDRAPREALRALLLAAPARGDLPSGCFITAASADAELQDAEVGAIADGFFRRTEARIAGLLVRMGHDASEARIRAGILHHGALGLRVRARVGLSLPSDLDDLLTVADRAV